MYKELETAKNKLVGTKQVLRALAAGEIATIYIAKDADNAIKEKILIAAGGSVQVVYTDSMKELGDCCGIDVRTACAAIKK